MKNGKFYLIDDRYVRFRSECLITGPYSAVEEAADATYAGWNEYKFYDIKMKITNRVFGK